MTEDSDTCSVCNPAPPDKSLDCYPCLCPDCPGYHMCDFFYDHLSYGQEASCEVCGYAVRYEPFTDEDMEEKDLPQSLKDRFYNGATVGGKYVTLVKRYK